MPQINHIAVAIYAAGIADALACVEAHAKSAGEFLIAVEEHGGHVGLMQQVAVAAEFMERTRIKHGRNAKWGAELPYLYDVWDAIARALLTNLDKQPLGQLVESAVDAVMIADAA